MLHSLASTSAYKLSVYYQLIRHYRRKALSIQPGVGPLQKKANNLEKSEKIQQTTSERRANHVHAGNAVVWSEKKLAGSGEVVSEQKLDKSEETREVSDELSWAGKPNSRNHRPPGPRGVTLWQSSKDRIFSTRSKVNTRTIVHESRIHVSYRFLAHFECRDGVENIALRKLEDELLARVVSTQGFSQRHAKYTSNGFKVQEKFSVSELGINMVALNRELIALAEQNPSFSLHPSDCVCKLCLHFFNDLR